jgi:predicted DNA-binding protein (UPF0251 family)
MPKKNLTEPICNFFGQRMDGQHITVNGQKIFSPFAAYDQDLNQQLESDFKATLEILKAALISSRNYTPKQYRSIEVQYVALERQKIGELSGSAMQEAARLLGVCRRTFDEHLFYAAAKYQGITYDQVLEQAAPLRKNGKDKKAEA